LVQCTHQHDKTKEISDTILRAHLLQGWRQIVCRDPQIQENVLLPLQHCNVMQGLLVMGMGSQQ
jgi:hypothetical protein